jgi:hypothetical protein
LSKQKLNLEQNITSLNSEIDNLKKLANAANADRAESNSKNLLILENVIQEKVRIQQEKDVLKNEGIVCENENKDLVAKNKDLSAKLANLEKNNSATPDSTSPSTELGIVRNSLLEKILSTDNKDGVIVDTIDPATSKETALTAVGINSLDSGNPPPKSMKLEIEEVREKRREIEGKISKLDTDRKDKLEVRRTKEKEKIENLKLLIGKTEEEGRALLESQKQRADKEVKALPTSNAENSFSDADIDELKAKIESTDRDTNEIKKQITEKEKELKSSKDKKEMAIKSRILAERVLKEGLAFE